MILFLTISAFIANADPMLNDTTPPASVTNLTETNVGTQWICWNWTDPDDTDFSHVMVYLNSEFVTNTSQSFHNATGLTEGTTYTLSTRTVDTNGTINSTWVNDSATTTSPADTTPPASVTELRENGTGTQWIKWEWTDPDDTDFSHVMIYIDSVFVANTTHNFYNRTGLDHGTTYDIGIRTVDDSGNINSTWVNDSATTTSPADTTPPASVTNLRETGTGTQWIKWEWTDPDDADFSHVMVYLNSVFITNTSQSFYNATGLTEGTTYTISIRTVDTNGNIGPSSMSDLAITAMLPEITSFSGTNITKTSITLIWEASGNTNRVQITRNGAAIANVSGPSSYIDSGLSSGTTYTYTLIPYNEDGLAGNSVSDSFTTISSSSGGGGSSRSSSGGGGGAASVEDFSNLALKEIDSKYLRMNANVVYEFTAENNPIRSISLYSLKNSGEITSTIEVLNSRSKLVDTTPEKLIYKYINIWVGKAGFATTSNIRNAVIKFKVSTSWIRQMDVSPEDIRLLRYNGTSWEVLPTYVESNDTEYITFRSQTPGFSPFAITAEKAIASPVTDEKAVITPVTGDTDIVQTEQNMGNADDEQIQTESSNTVWIFFLAILLIGVYAVGSEYIKKEDN